TRRFPHDLYGWWQAVRGDSDRLEPDRQPGGPPAHPGNSRPQPRFDVDGVCVAGLRTAVIPGPSEARSPEALSSDSAEPSSNGGPVGLRIWIPDLPLRGNPE